MKFEGTVDIGAPREKVWAFLMDPNQVGPCGPGVETIEVVDETHFKAKAKVGIGFISARFNVAMDIAERDEPNRAVIKARGQAPGSAVDATATMALKDGAAGGTIVENTIACNGRPGSGDPGVSDRRRSRGVVAAESQARARLDHRLGQLGRRLFRWLKDKGVSFTEDAVATIVTRYTRESGVRQLERQVGAVARKVARKIAAKILLADLEARRQSLDDDGQLRAVGLARSQEPEHGGDHRVATVVAQTHVPSRSGP